MTKEEERDDFIKTIRTAASLPPKPCPDCKVEPGTPHRSGCDIDRCSTCGDQRVSCQCVIHDRYFSRWSGWWPGLLECAARGKTFNDITPEEIRLWFVKPTRDET